MDGKSEAGRRLVNIGLGRVSVISGPVSALAWAACQSVLVMTAFAFVVGFVLGAALTGGFWPVDPRGFRTLRRDRTAGGNSHPFEPYGTASP